MKPVTLQGLSVWTSHWQRESCLWSLHLQNVLDRRGVIWFQKTSHTLSQFLVYRPLLASHGLEYKLKEIQKRKKWNTVKKNWRFKNYVPWITYNSKLSAHARFCHEINEGPVIRVAHTWSYLGLCTGRACALLSSPCNSFCRNQKKESENNLAGSREHGGLWPTYLGHTRPSPSFHW